MSSCPHVWGDGPDLDHRACVKCGHVVKLVWVEPYRAPPIPEDEVRTINNGGGIEHIPTGLRVLNGEHPHFYQRREALWEELARRVEAHCKEQAGG